MAKPPVPKMEDLTPEEQRWAREAYEYLSDRVPVLPAGVLGDRETVHMSVPVYWNALHLPHILAETNADGKPTWQNQRTETQEKHDRYRFMLISGAWGRSLWNRLPQVAHAVAAVVETEGGKDEALVNDSIRKE